MYKKKFETEDFVKVYERDMNNKVKCAILKDKRVFKTESKTNEKKGKKMTEFPMMDDLDIDEVGTESFEDANEFAISMGFIGSGQAGGKFCQKFYDLGYRKVIALNSTEQDFKGLTFPSKLVIGSEGKGAGKDRAVGKKLAEESQEQIYRKMRDVFGESVERIMVCVASGGGTGSGSCMTVVKCAQDYLKSLGKEPKVGVIVTNPAKSEGGRSCQNASELMGELIPLAHSKEISPVVVTDNEKVLKLYKKVSISKFYEVINSQVSGLFSIFNSLCAQDSEFQTMDIADYKSILDAGLMTMGMTPVKAANSETAIADAIEKNTKNTMLSDLNITKASHAGGLLVAAEENLQEIPQSAFEIGFETLMRIIGGEVMLHRGVYTGKPEMGDKAFLYTIVAGITDDRYSQGQAAV